MSAMEKLSEKYYFRADSFDWDNVAIVRSNDELKISKELIRKTKLYDVVNSNSYYGNYSNPKGTVGIVYSGGYDSTWLMLKALDEGKTVRPIFFDFLGDWIVREININILKQEYPNKVLEPLRIAEIGLPMNGLETRGMGQQPTIHFYLGFLNNQCYSTLSEIQVGYVMGDNAISFQTELKNIHRGVALIQGKKPIPIKYPLAQIDKSDVNTKVCDFLNKHNFDLITYSCELPNITVCKARNGLCLIIELCKKCHSCQRNNDMGDYFVDCKYKVVKLPYNLSEQIEQNERYECCYEDNIEEEYKDESI